MKLNYRNYHYAVILLAIPASFFFLGMYIGPPGFRIAMGVGLLICLLGMIGLQFWFWRCPHCNALLPFDRKILNGNHTYCCTNCGKEIR